MRELEMQDERNKPHLPDDAPTLDAKIASLLTFPTNSAARNDEPGEGSALRALGSGNKSRKGAGRRRINNSCEDAEARQRLERPHSCSHQPPTPCEVSKHPSCIFSAEKSSDKVLIGLGD
jgi:hypothetical protein